MLSSEPLLKTTLSQDEVDSSCALTESSTTCEDSFDELTLDGSSSCSSYEEDEITNERYTTDVPFILEEEDVCDDQINAAILIQDTCFVKSESEYCAVVMIQDTWRQCRQRESIKLRLAKELHASHVIYRTWCTWCSSKRANITKTKMIETAAVTLIQVKWQNYLARIDLINHLEKLSRRKAQKEEEEMFARCIRLEDEILTFFS